MKILSYLRHTAGEKRGCSTETPKFLEWVTEVEQLLDNKGEEEWAFLSFFFSLRREDIEFASCYVFEKPTGHPGRDITVRRGQKLTVGKTEKPEDLS